MQHIDIDPDQVHRFRCPAAGCHLKDKVDFSRYCDSEHYEKPEGRLLRIVELLPRCSEEWKTEYRKRPSIERYFSSAKHSRLLASHRCLNIRKVSLHVAVSMLTYLATALARLNADDYAGIRSMRIDLPSQVNERTPLEKAKFAIRPPAALVPHSHPSATGVAKA